MKTFTLLLSAVAATSWAAEAPAPGPVRLTPAFINQLAGEMRTNHPALRSAGARTEAARANVGSVRAWDDPTVQLGAMSARRETRADDGDLIYGVEQKLPLFGKPQLARKVAQAELATEQANTTYQFQLLRRELAKTLFNNALADRIVEVGVQDLAWLETMVAATDAKYRAGQASLVELLQLQNEQSKRIDQLRTDRNDLAHDRLALNRLLNREFDAAWPGFELPPLAAPLAYQPRLVDVALRHEPKIKMMREEIKQAEATVQLTKRQRLPDVSVGLEGRNYTGDSSFRQGTLLFSVNLPWGNAGRYRSDIARDTARLQATQLGLTDYELSVQQEVHQLTVRIDAARREALLYREQIIPRSEQALASARAAWENGRSPFRDLLDARRMLLDAHLMHARAVAGQYQQMSELVQACGLDSLEALETLTAPSEPTTKP